jgi:Na+/citrate or Na+/malate symporter
MYMYIGQTTIHYVILKSVSMYFKELDITVIRNTDICVDEYSYLSMYISLLITT